MGEAGIVAHGFFVERALIIAALIRPLGGLRVARAGEKEV